MSMRAKKNCGHFNSYSSFNVQVLHTACGFYRKCQSDLDGWIVKATLKNNMSKKKKKKKRENTGQSSTLVNHTASDSGTWLDTFLASFQNLLESFRI